MIYQRRRKQQSLYDLHSKKAAQRISVSRPQATIIEQQILSKSPGKLLGQSISKFWRRVKKQDGKDTEQTIRNALQVIKGFGEVQNNFQHLFQQMYHILHRYCFTLTGCEISETLAQLQIRQGQSYRRTSQILNEKLTSILKGQGETIQHLMCQLKEKAKQKQERQIKWSRQKLMLTSEVQKFKKMANIEYIQSLEVNIDQQKGEINQKIAEVKHIKKENQTIKHELIMKNAQISSLESLNAQLKTDIFDMQNKYSRTDEFLSQMHQKFDHLHAKMQGLKDIIAKLEIQNSTLASEKGKLLQRASVSSTSELTPRPNIRSSLKMPASTNLRSTQSIFDILLQHSTISSDQLSKKVTQRQPNLKVVEAEGIRENAAKELMECKEKINIFKP